MMTSQAKTWVHEGDYETVSAAAGRIVEIEEYPVKGLFLEAHALPGTSDDETLGHFGIFQSKP